MKVLVVSQYYWPEGFRINEVVASLIGKGIEVEVLTGKPNYPEGRLFAGYRGWGCSEGWHDGARILRVPLSPRGAKSPVRLVLNYLSFIVSALLLGPWLLRHRRYDVVFVYAPSPLLQAIPALWLGRLKRCPVVLWVQDLWPESLSATGYVSKRWILSSVESVVRWIYRHVDLLLVQSRAFVPAVSALAPGKPVIYYPNSVDDSFSRPPDPAVALPDIPALESGFPVLFAGNVGAGQAVEVIVEAAERLRDYPEVRFVVIGQGSRWEWMRQQVVQRGLSNLHLPGRFPVDTMPGLMQKAGALLVSLSDQPIFALTVPNKVQAYLAAGRPILACLNGEGARLVEEAGAGLAVAAEDAEALAAAVLHLYGMSHEEREMLGENGRRYFKEHFFHDRLVDDLIGHLTSMAAEAGQAT